MPVNTWILVAGEPAVGNLIDNARLLGGEVAAAVVGARQVADTVAAGGVDRVVWFGDPGQAPVEAFAPAVAEAVAAAPGAVLGGGGPIDRVLLGAVAARLQAPALTGISAVSADGDDVVVVRSVFGGIAVQTVAIAGPVALVLDGGSVPTGSGVAPVEEVAAHPLGMKVVDTRTSGFEAVDLGAAARVVGIGRGLRAQEDLVMIQALATAADAEVACSRPLAEGVSWLSRDRYVGVSGQHIAPELYFVIGISGQFQHMVGARGAKTIVAINSDAAAPVFKDADYGLVGDLYQIVPALTEALA